MSACWVFPIEPERNASLCSGPFIFRKAKRVSPNFQTKLDSYTEGATSIYLDIFLEPDYDKQVCFGFQDLVAYFCPYMLNKN